MLFRSEGSFGENRQTQHSNSSIPSKKSNFKYVRESDRGKTSTTGDPVRPDQHKERWIEVAAILAALVLCCLGVAYFLQPPNPARLFAPIETALASGDDNRLLEIEDQVAAFESKFPNHPKIEVVHDAAREIDYLKRLRILERPTRKRLAEEKGGVFETLTEIHRWRVVDPDRKSTRLNSSHSSVSRMPSSA